MQIAPSLCIDVCDLRVDEKRKSLILLGIKLKACAAVKGEGYVFVGGGAYSFVACLSHLTIDHASLSRRSTVPTPNRDTSNIWALITLFPYIT